MSFKKKNNRILVQVDSLLVIDYKPTRNFPQLIPLLFELNYLSIHIVAAAARAEGMGVFSSAF
jgi:hypothetical protein